MSFKPKPTLKVPSLDDLPEVPKNLHKRLELVARVQLAAHLEKSIEVRWQVVHIVRGSDPATVSHRQPMADCCYEAGTCVYGAMVSPACTLLQVCHGQVLMVVAAPGSSHKSRTRPVAVLHCGEAHCCATRRGRREVTSPGRPEFIAMLRAVHCKCMWLFLFHTSVGRCVHARMAYGSAVAHGIQRANG